jgi:predicted permease
MTLRECLSRAFALFRRRELEAQTEAEMRFHVEMEIEAGMRRGLSREEAERRARLRAGSHASSSEAVRDERGFAGLDGLVVDLRQAWNSLRRRPGFLFTAVGALGAAVAVNTLVFAIVYGVLLRPLPYHEPDRLVRIFEQSLPQPRFPVSIYNYREDLKSNRTLAGLALYVREDMQLMHDERPEQLTAVAITDTFFPTLGVSPALGRNFLASDMLHSARVVILSYGFWSSRLNADPAILGKTLRLDRESWTVIGVAPRGFEHVGGSYRSPLQGETVAIWRPLPLETTKDNEGCQKGCHYTNAIARLAPGVSIAAASEDLNRIMADLGRRFPDFYKDKKARLEPLSAEVVGKSRTAVLIIMAAGTLVLLLASINVAGLSVARVLTRRRELAIRRALGARGWRIARAVLSEILIVGAISGVIGLAVAAGLMPALRALLPADFPRLHEIVFRWPDAGFSLVAGLAASVLAGLVAVARETGKDPSEGLHEDSRTASASRGTERLRGGLVAAEMALACVLCFAAGLLMRSSLALEERPHGFRPEGALTFELAFPSQGYDGERRAAFLTEVVRRFHEIPGVQAAGFSTSLPWTGYDENSSFDIQGYTARPGEDLSARYQAADPEFFDAIGTRLVRGRMISPSDNAKAPKVVVVNEAFSRRYFAHSDALDRIVKIWDHDRRIVGVVEDIRDRPADIAAEPAFWMPLAQEPFGRVEAAIRTSGDPLTLVPAVRAAIHSVDRELPVSMVQSLDSIAAAALAERHFALRVCESFAALALALAGIGVYAMLAYSVEQRRREIGIRLALGATRSNVLAMVFSHGLWLALIGGGAGVLLAPAAGRALASLLYGVTPGDVFMLLAAPILILAITLLGCLAPGWMAVRNEPISALRDQ